jgi:hypothetical protein
MTQRELFEHSLAELQLQVEKHAKLAEVAFEGRQPKNLKCVWSCCPHQRMLYKLLLETVQALDDTRKAFKSRQLEQLRKRLLEALSQEANEEIDPKYL